MTKDSSIRAQYLGPKAYRGWISDFCPSFLCHVTEVGNK